MSYFAHRQADKGVDFGWMGFKKNESTCTEDEQACRIRDWTWEDETEYDPDKWHDWGAKAEPQKDDVCVSMVLAHNGWDVIKADDCILPQKYICEKGKNFCLCNYYFIRGASKLDEMHGVRTQAIF